MTPIQQQLAALAEWHRQFDGPGTDPGQRQKHRDAAALLDKLAKAETTPVFNFRDTGCWETNFAPSDFRTPNCKYATAILIPEE